MKLRSGLLLLVLAVPLVVSACSTDAPQRTPTPPAFDPVERFDIEGRPSAIAVASGKVFVADDQNHLIHVLDERTGETVGDAIEVEDNPISMAADDGLVWVGHAGGSLTRIEARTLRTTRKQIGGSITDVVAQDGGVWSIDLEGGGAAEIDPDTSEVKRGVTIPKGAVRGAVGKEGLWVTGSDDAISRVELGPFVVRHVYPKVGGGPLGIAWDGHVMWAAISDEDVVIDVEGKTHPKPIEVGGGPVALAVFGDELWVVNQDDSTVSRIHGEKVDAIDVGVQGRDIAAGETAVWIAGTNREAVVRVEP